MNSIRLSLTDGVSLWFCTFLILLNIFFFPSIPSALLIIAVNIVLIALILFLARKESEQPNTFISFLRQWYPLLLIPLVFKETYGMIRPLWNYDFDDVLIAIDRWMFGVNPTQWLEKISFPLLTEIFQLAYTSYYLLFLLLGFELYRRKKKEEFQFAIFCIVYGFFLSYVGYFLVPAVGPRFTLHDFSRLETELPGLFFTDFFRAMINAGESIPANVPHPETFVQRDVFPSGHTQLTLIVMYFAMKYRVQTRWFILCAGTLLLFSTVYLRYHYVIDVLGGILFMAGTIWSAEKMRKGKNSLYSQLL
ncbi:MAG: phosphatase PAP2 family protein [Ignavibacteriales bacterium]|nr:phosphatase PAP2 family protein [Ignavibacteriales bacterium]